MIKKIVLYMLLLCLIAVPGSAWELGFESNPDDEFYNPGVIGTSTMSLSTSTGSNNYYESYISNSAGADEYITINKGFSNYISFSCFCGTYAYAGGQRTITLTLYNSTDAIITNYVFPVFNGEGDFKYEVVRIGNTDQFELFKNNVKVSTFTGFETDEVVTKIKLNLKCSFSGSYYRVDDFTTDDNFILGYASPVNTGSPFIISYGYVPFNDLSFNVSIYDLNGNILESKSISNYCGYKSFTSPSVAGNYKVRITGKNLSDPASPNYFIYTKNLEVTGVKEIDFKVELDKSSYSLGEMARISTHVSPYNSNYRMIFKYGDKYIENSITKEDQVFQMVVPLSLKYNYVFAYIVDSKGDVVAYDQAEVTFSSVSRVVFDKESYSHGDVVKISYEGAPSGSTISLHVRSGNVVTASQDWSVNGNGAVTYTIPGPGNSDNLMVVLTGSDRVLAYDTAKVVTGTFHVSGRVYDAVTGVPVSGATIDFNGNSDVTDGWGNYGIGVTAGRQIVNINCSGYENYLGKANVFDLFTQKDFWIVPISEYEGSSVYGNVISAITGVPIENARVRIYNSTFSKTDYTDNKGYYEVKSGLVSGSYRIRVELNGYDSIDRVVVVDGATHESFRLIASSGYEEDGSDPDGGSGTVPEQVDETDYTKSKYGAYGRHAFDFNGDAKVSADEWKYAFEHLIIAVGCLCFMGFLTIVGRAGRR